METILKELNVLKKSSIKERVESRMQEFEKFQGANNSQVFGELCFCLMTANFQAEKSMKIQADLNNKFHKLSQDELAAALRQHGHRFPNTRASFIFEARKHCNNIKDTLDSISDDSARREWVVKNVKGLGMKESSHFLRNIGYKNYAIIDFHIVDKLAEHGLIEKPKSKAITPKRYLEIEQILKQIGDKAGLNQGELDLYLWYAETGKILK